MSLPTSLILILLSSTTIVACSGSDSAEQADPRCAANDEVESVGLKAFCKSEKCPEFEDFIGGPFHSESLGPMKDCGNSIFAFREKGSERTHYVDDSSGKLVGIRIDGGESGVCNEANTVVGEVYCRFPEEEVALAWSQTEEITSLPAFWVEPVIYGGAEDTYFYRTMTDYGNCTAWMISPEVGKESFGRWEGNMNDDIEYRTCGSLALSENKIFAVMPSFGDEEAQRPEGEQIFSFNRIWEGGDELLPPEGLPRIQAHDLYVMNDDRVLAWYWDYVDEAELLFLVEHRKTEARVHYAVNARRQGLSKGLFLRERNAIFEYNGAILSLPLSEWGDIDETAPTFIGGSIRDLEELTSGVILRQVGAKLFYRDGQDVFRLDFDTGESTMVAVLPKEAEPSVRVIRRGLLWMRGFEVYLQPFEGDAALVWSGGGYAGLMNSYSSLWPLDWESSHIYLKTWESDERDLLLRIELP